MILFVRHGESEANLRGVFAGQRDNSLLTPRGKEQAQKSAEQIKLKNLHIDRVISSPLIRTLETSRIICKELGFDESQIEIDNRINEYDMGSITGTPVKDISSEKLTTAENAEDPIAFQNRVENFLNEYKDKNEDILVVSHAGVGRIIESIKQNMDPHLFYDLPAYPNASIIEVA